MSPPSAIPSHRKKARFLADATSLLLGDLWKRVVISAMAPIEGTPGQGQPRADRGDEGNRPNGIGWCPQDVGCDPSPQADHLEAG